MLGEMLAAGAELYAEIKDSKAWQETTLPKAKRRKVDALQVKHPWM